MNKYYIDILRKKTYIPKLLNKIKQMVNKNQFGYYYWFARYLVMTTAFLQNNRYMTIYQMSITIVPAILN